MNNKYNSMDDSTFEFKSIILLNSFRTNKHE